MQLFIFDHYMNELRTILTESDVISATETKEINKAGTLDLEVPLKAFDIKETDMLLVWTGTENRYHVYRVIQRTVDNSILTIKANEYAYHLMKADGIIHDKRPNDMSVRDVLAHVIIDNGDEGVYGWEVGYVSSDLPNFTGNFYREDRLSCLSKIAEKCNAEFEFIFTIKNNKIDKRLIEAYDEIGTDTGKRFEYGDNLLSVVAETDASEIYTRAYGYGAGVPTGDGYGHKLDLTGVAWSSEAGYPVTKEDWWDFMLDTRGNWKDYQLDNGTDPSTIFDFPDCKVENGEDQEEIKRAKEELAWLTFNALQEVNRPKVQFKAQVAYAGELKLGDRVNIVRSDINVRYKTRVFKTVRDLVNPALTTVELGDKVGTTTGEMIESITNQITNANNQITNIQNNIDIIENNTGNHVFYGPDMPAGHKVGDVWFETHEIEGGTQTIIHVWDGERWVISYDPKKFEELKQTIEDAKKKTEEAIKRAEEAVSKGEALEKEFEESVTDITNKVDSVANDVQSNKEDVNKKLEDFNNSLNDKVNSSDYTSTIDKINSQITTTVEKVTDNEHKISEVTQKADGIQTSVSDLKNNTESKFTQLDSIIQSKVSKDEYETSQTITNNKIEQVVKDTTANAEKISKVEQTADGIQSTVKDLQNNTESKFTQLNDAIQSKVNKDDFEASQTIVKDQISQVVKDTTANAEKISEINQKADGIQIKVDDLKNNTESKFTVLDDLIKSTVSQIGASYPNSTFNDADVHKYYETFNDKTTIEDYIKGTGLIFRAETGDSPSYLQTSYTDYEHFPNFNNLMWFDFEHELTFEGNGNVYVQIYKYNEFGDEINHEYFNLDANKGRINQKHNFWYDAGSVHHIRWCIGANLSEHSKFELKLYKMRFGANGDESQWNMYLKDSHYDRYFDKNGYMSPITANSNNKVLKLDGDVNNPDAFSNAKLKDFIKVDPKQKLTVTFNSLVEYSYKSKRECFILLHQFDANKEKIKEDRRWIKYDRSSEWFENTQDYDLESNTEYVKIEFIYWYKGTPETATLYIDNVYVRNGKENISSSITQLANNINIKVDKNDVINQINVSDEEVLIQGNRIHLTGETMIDDAIITNAMIKDLTADKITAGTINGENINIVNVRAENITGNTTNFVQSAWNSVNGSIQIDGNSLKIYNKSNGERIDFSNGSLKFLASSGYEICGLSRFSDGQVRLAINQGYHFYLVHRPQGWEEGNYNNIIGFDGRDGNMRVPQQRALFIGNGADPFRFGTTAINGIGQYPTLRSPNMRCGIALGDDDIWFLIDGKAWNMSFLLSHIGL